MADGNFDRKLLVMGLPIDHGVVHPPKLTLQKDQHFPIAVELVQRNFE